MVFKFLSDLKQEVGESNFEIILDMTELDIKFNRLAFGKRTNQMEYVNICSRTAQTVIRAGIQ